MPNMINQNIKQHEIIHLDEDDQFHENNSLISHEAGQKTEDPYAEINPVYFSTRFLSGSYSAQFNHPQFGVFYGSDHIPSNRIDNSGHHTPLPPPRYFDYTPAGNPHHSICDTISAQPYYTPKSPHRTYFNAQHDLVSSHQQSLHHPQWHQFSNYPCSNAQLTQTVETSHGCIPYPDPSLRRSSSSISSFHRNALSNQRSRYSPYQRQCRKETYRSSPLPYHSSKHDSQNDTVKAHSVHQEEGECDPEEFYEIKKEPTYIKPSPSSKHYYCQPCDQVFYTKSRYLQHVQEEHVKCEEADCSFSAPIHIMEAHQIQHIKGEDGVPILNNSQDQALWLESRKQNHPSRQKNKNPSTPRNTSQQTRSALEKILRSRMIRDPLEMAIRKKLMSTSGLFPDLKNLMKRRRHVRSSKNHSSVQPISKYRGKFTDAQLAKDFCICTHYLQFKVCKWNPCHYSHDIESYRAWKIQRHARGFNIPMRPPLYYQMILPELKQCESLILQALTFIAENNFFQEETDFCIQDGACEKQNSDLNELLSSVDSESICDETEEW